MIFVPSDAGALVVVGSDGSVRSVKVASAPLYRPVIDPGRHRLLATAGDGTLAAISLGE
jgi:hypothetical protein